MSLLDFKNNIKNSLVYENKSEEVKGTPSHACFRGSFTVEAALVIPIYVMFLTTLLFFFHSIHISRSVYEGGLETARELSGRIEQSPSFINVNILLQKNVKLDKSLEKFIERRRLGIVAQNIKTRDGVIAFEVHYTLRLPIEFFSIKTLKMSHKIVTRQWIGYEKDHESKEEYVFVAEHGEVYHTSLQCSYLDLSIHQGTLEQVVNKRNLSGERYEACKKCGENINSQWVYYTDYGDNYHSSLNCPYLKRTVERIKKEETNLNECSRCRGRAYERSSNDLFIGDWNL